MIRSVAGIAGAILSLAFLALPAQANNWSGYQKPIAIVGPNVTATTGEAITIDGSGSIAPSGEILRYYWKLLERPDGSQAQLWGRYNPRVKLVPDVAGDYRIRFYARGQSYDSIEIVVSTENSLPNADAGISRRVALGDVARLEGWRSSDFDGDDLIYDWTTVASPNGSTSSLDDPSSPEPSFTVDVDGDYVFSLKVSDDGLRWSEASNVTISTNAVRPTPGSYAPRALTLGGPRVYFDAGLSRGSDAASITWNLLRGARGYTYNVFGRFYGLAKVRASRYAGDFVVQLKLRNTAGSSYAAVLTTTGNAPPVAEAVVVSIASDGSSASLDGAGSWDTNGDAITYRWSVLRTPDGAVAEFDDATSARPNLTLGAEGVYIAQLIVRDDALYSRPQTIRIEAGRSAPVAEAGEPMTLDPGGTAVLDGSGSSDLDGQVLTYAWNLVAVTGTTSASLILDDPQAAIPSLQFSTNSADYNYYNSSRYCRPGSGYGAYCRGHAVYQLTVTDEDGLESTDSVAVSFNGSRAVARTGDDLTAAVGEMVTLDGSASADTDGTSITARWTVLSIPEGSQATLSDPASLTPEFTADQDGLYIFQLVVRGPVLLSEPDTVVVAVGGPTNTAPIAALAASSLQVEVGETAQFDASPSSDPDGDALTYSWSAAGAPADSTAALDDPASTTPSFSPDRKGTYGFALTVSDGVLSSAPVNLTLTVPNRDPEAQIASAGTGPFDTGAPITFDAAGSTDADADVLTYAWAITNAPAGTSPSLAPEGSAVSVTADLPGSYTLELTVTDSDGGTSTETVSFDVIQPNLPPQIAAIGDQNNAVGETLSLTVSASDPDGDTLAYAIEPLPLPEGASFDQATGTFTWRPQTAVTQAFTVSVSDGTNTTSETFTVSFTQDTPNGPTLYSGRVLDADAFAAGTETPLAGAIVTIGGVSATTDANGMFSMDLADAAGTVSATVEPGPLAGYGGTEGAVSLIAGAANVAQAPFLLPTVGAGTPLNPDTDTTITDPGTNVSVTVPPGSATNTDGTPYTGPVTLASLPPSVAGNPTETGFEACELVSVLPKGVSFSTPAQVSLPNTDNLVPGTQVELWAFDTASLGYSVAGKGVVSEDGSEITTTQGGLSAATTFTVVPVHLNVDEAEDQTAEFMIPSLLGEGNATAMVSPPSWTTFGDDRSAPMLYNSTAAAPNPIIAINATIPEVTGVPERFVARLEVGGRLAAETIYTKPTNATAALSESVEEVIRQAAQFDATDYATGRYDYRFILTAEYGCSKTISVQEGRVLVRNQSDSPYGTGWSVAGLPSITPLPDGGALLDDGDGSLKMFDRQATGNTFEATPVVIPARYPGGPAGEFDFNNDGLADIAINERFASRTRFFENEGNGTFAEIGEFQVGNPIEEPTDPDATSIFPDISASVAADFNNDGNIDLAYGLRFTKRLIVALGDGAGGFTKLDIAATGDAPNITAGDFDGDGNTDIAVGGFFWRMYFGDGAGGFTDPNAAAVGGLYLVAVDLDGDGDDEVVGMPSIANLFGIYIYDFVDGAVIRTSTPTGGMLSVPLFGRNTYVRDVNSDGEFDIIAVGQGEFLVSLGNGDKTFQAPVRYSPPAGFNSTSLDGSSLSDADGDGDLDFYWVPSPAVASFYIARNDGNGDFSDIEEVPFAVAGQVSLGFREYNNDGSADLTVSNLDGYSIYLSDPVQSKTFLQVANDFTNLVEKEGGGYLRTYPDGSYQDFDATGRLTSLADAFNRVTSFAYDGEGRLLTRTDPGGTVTTYTYGPDGRLASIGDPLDRTTGFEYNAAGRMIAVTYPDASTQTFQYDAQGRVVSDTDRLGDVSTYAYGTTGRLSSSIAPDGRTTSLDIARDIGLDQFGGSLGGATDPLAYVAPEDRVTTMRDERGLPYRSTVNEFGSIVRAEEFSGKTLSYIRDDEDRVIEFSETNGLPFYALEPGQEETNLRHLPRPSSPWLFPALQELIGVTPAHAQDTCSSANNYGGGAPAGREDRFGSFRYIPRTSLISRRVEAQGTILERVTTYEYALLDRTGEDGETIPSRLMTKMIDAVGNETRYEYDANANLSKVIDALGQQAIYVHTRQGLLTSFTDFAGRETTFTYDAVGNLASVTNANGIITEVLRDASGRPVLLKEAVGTPDERRTSYEYDTNNRVAEITDAVGSVYGFNFDANGNLRRETLPDALETTHDFNDRDWPTTMSTPDRGDSATSYPKVVRQFQSRDSRFPDIEIEHYKRVFTDSEGREFSTEWKPRIGEAFDYYPCANILQQRVWIAGYRLESVDALGQKRTEEYDGADRLIAVTDARGNTTRFKYDILDRMIERTNPNGDTWAFEYDALDRRTATVDAKGQRITFAYDALSRLTGQTAPDDAYTFGYDAVDNLTAANDNDTAYAMTYDVLDRLTSVTASGSAQPASTLTYTYDALDRRASVSDQGGGTQSYTFDGEDRLTELDSNANGRFTLNYDPVGRHTLTLAPNSVLMNSAYEPPTGRLDTMSYLLNSAAVEQFDYSYDAGGDFASIEDVSAQKTYLFDNLERLTGVTTNAAATESYSYDAEGNEAGAGAVYDAANRLTEDDTYTYGYDANGNLTSRTAKADGAVTAYAYDAFDRMVGIVFADGTTASYAYDIFGRRVRKDVPDGAGGRKLTGYTYDGPDILLETDGSGTLLARYSHGQRDDQPLGLERYGVDATPGAGEQFTYHADHLGSIRAITTAAGAIAEARDFDAFGAPLAAAVVDQPYGFTGREYDAESGLYYYRARHYDPATGRFLQEDPLGFEAGDLNLYRYTWNDPLHWTDPSGMVAATEHAGLSKLGFATGNAVGGGVSQGVRCVLNGIAGALAAANAGKKVSGVNLGKCAAQAAAAGLSAAIGGPITRGGGGALGAAAKGGSGLQKTSSGGGAKFFRVVDDVEFKDIKNTNGFRTGPNSFEGKQFVDNIADAQKLRDKFAKFFGGNQTIVGANVPNSVVDKAVRVPFADIPRGVAITISPADLPKITPLLR